MNSAPAREPGAPEPAITLRRVSQLFGSFPALREVSLSVPPGSSVVLLGPNGSGKSTLLRLLAGLATPTYGELRIHGQPPASQRGRIAYMGHATMLYDELTGVENLLYLLRLHHPRLASPALEARAAAALEAVGLDPALPQRVGEYSQGMRQRASLARVLLTGPSLLLLDEPFSNLDIASAHAMIARLQRYLADPDAHGARGTLVLTTHQAELARPLAGLTLTLEAGRLVGTVAGGTLPASLPAARGHHAEGAPAA